MSILHIHISRETARYFGVVLAMVAGIFVVFDFLEKVDDFIEADVPLSRAFSFLAFKMPFVVTQVTPLGILLSVLIVFGLMSRNNEVIALKAGGISIYHLAKPAVAIGVLLSALLFAVSEILVPVTMDRANDIWLREVRKEKAVASREENIWVKGDRQISHIRYYDRNKQTIFGVTLNFFDDTYRLARRIDAPRGSFGAGGWTLEDAMVQQLVVVDETYSVTMHDRWVVPLALLPDDLERVVKKSEEMGFAELHNYITKIESEGYDASAYRVDLHAKIAFPMVCLIMAIVGTGISLKGSRMEGLPVSIFYGIVVALLYYVSYSLCMSHGYGGALPPIVAAWTANLLFSCLGGFLLLNAE